MTTTLEIELDDDRQFALMTVKESAILVCEVFEINEDQSFEFGSKKWTERNRNYEITARYKGQIIPFELTDSEIKQLFQKLENSRID